MLTDSQGALQAIANPLTCQLPLLAAEITRNLETIKARGWQISLAWIPSHGKQVRWLSPKDWQCSAGQCRALNKKADRAAEEAREAHATCCRRAQWWQQWFAAKSWEERAIDRSAKAADALELFYRQVQAGHAAETAGVPAPTEADASVQLATRP